MVKRAAAALAKGKAPAAKRSKRAKSEPDAGGKSSAAAVAPEPAAPPQQQFWLLKSEPDLRMEKGYKVSLSFDELKVRVRGHCDPMMASVLSSVTHSTTICHVCTRPGLEEPDFGVGRCTKLSGKLKQLVRCVLDGQC